MNAQWGDKLKQIMVNVVILIGIFLAIQVSINDTIQKMGWAAGVVVAVIVSAIHRYYFPSPNFESNIIRATLAIVLGAFAYLIVTMFVPAIL